MVTAPRQADDTATDYAGDRSALKSLSFTIVQ